MGIRRSLAAGVAWVGMVLASGVLVLSLGAVSGCSSFDEARMVQEDLQSLREDLDQRAEELAISASQMDPADPGRAQAEALASAAKARARAVDTGLGHLGAVLDEAQSPSDPVTRVVQSLSELLPEPLRVSAVLAAAAGGLAWRSSRLKGGLRSVALSIEAAKRTDEEFRRCFERHVEMFQAAQSPLAQKVIRATTHPAAPA